MVMAVVGGIIMLVALFLVLNHAEGFKTVAGSGGSVLVGLVKQLQGG